MLEDHMRLLAQFEKQKIKYEAKIDKIENEKKKLAQKYDQTFEILKKQQ